MDFLDQSICAVDPDPITVPLTKASPASSFPPRQPGSSSSGVTR